LEKKVEGFNLGNLSENDELEISNLLGSRLLRGNILECNSDSNSYLISSRDWLVSHEATEKVEFNATK